MKTNDIRIEDPDKLREKVNEALNVFNEYQKHQAPDGQENQAPEARANEGESEEKKA